MTPEWLAYCGRGKISAKHQRASVERCMDPDGQVRGAYSDLVLDPTLPNQHSLYPSHDHVTHPRDHSKMVVDARVVNDMKTHLTEDEFWRMVEHLYAVGVAKGKIPTAPARRLEASWCTIRHYGSIVEQAGKILSTPPEDAGMPKSGENKVELNL